MKLLYRWIPIAVGALVATLGCYWWCYSNYSDSPFPAAMIVFVSFVSGYFVDKLIKQKTPKKY